MEDMSCQMIFGQTEYYRGVFGDGTQEFNIAVSLLCYFYRWIVNEYKEYDFFGGSLKITHKLLFSLKMTEYLKEHYFFTTFSPSNVPVGHSKIVYITYGFGEFGNKFLTEDCFSLNLSKLESVIYRDLILDYIATSSSVWSLSCATKKAAQRLLC